MNDLLLITILSIYQLFFFLFLETIIQIHTWYFLAHPLQAEKITRISFSAQRQDATEWVTSQEIMQHIEGIVFLNITTLNNLLKEHRTFNDV